MIYYSPSNDDFYGSGYGFDHPLARGFNDTLGRCYGDGYCRPLAGEYVGLCPGTFLYVCALFSEINLFYTQKYMQ